MHKHIVMQKQILIRKICNSSLLSSLEHHLSEPAPSNENYKDSWFSSEICMISTQKFHMQLLQKALSLSQEKQQQWQLKQKRTTYDDIVSQLKSGLLLQYNMSNAFQEKRQCMKVLKGWRQQKPKKVTHMLIQLQNYELFNSQHLPDLYHALTDFHRQIIKAQQSLLDLDWFKLCIQIRREQKKKLEWLQRKKNQQLQQAKHAFQNSTIEYPPELTDTIVLEDEQRYVKMLFRGFVIHFWEAMKDPRTPLFIGQLLKHLKHKFRRTPNFIDSLDRKLKRRVASIATRLSRQESKQAKQKMLAGSITPQELSNDDVETYLNQQTRQYYHRLQIEQLQNCSVDFSEEIKKKINKQVTEDCRYCQQRAAYCQEQKQISKADQPTTRQDLGRLKD